MKTARDIISAPCISAASEGDIVELNFRNQNIKMSEKEATRIVNCLCMALQARIDTRRKMQAEAESQRRLRVGEFVYETAPQIQRGQHHH